MNCAVAYNIYLYFEYLHAINNNVNMILYSCVIGFSSFTIRRGNMSRGNIFLTSADQNASRASRFHLMILKGFLHSLFRCCAAGIVSFANSPRARKLYCTKHRAASDCEIWRSCTIISALPIAHCPLIYSILIIGYALSLILSWRSASSTSR